MKEQIEEKIHTGIIIQLFGIFKDLPEQQKVELGDLYGSYLTSERNYALLINQLDLKIGTARLELAAVQSSIDQITENLEYNREYYAKNSVRDWSRGRSNIILERIRMLIYKDPKVLPWPLRFFSRFGLNDHPQILGIESYRNSYIDQYNGMKERQERDAKEDAEVFSPKIDLLRRDLKHTEATFLEFCANQAAQSLN